MVQPQTQPKRTKVQREQEPKQLQGPTKHFQEEESSIFQEINLVGNNNTFDQLKFPKLNIKSDKKTEVYTSF